MLGLPRFPKSKPAMKAEVVKPEPKVVSLTDRDGIEWRVYADSQSRAMAGEWLSARFGETTVRTFLPDRLDDLGPYKTYLRDDLLEKLTPLENFLMTGRAFQ